ncbi:MAG TPA: efflux RND transporter periplasmic adaptor subunit [Thermoanaerobaculia bacterium]|jgi:HlyD family secretion protein|nr:efflux RND transporter periplasmic adaptor subunit [Thermoanaerobaculia bacterium]
MAERPKRSRKKLFIWIGILAAVVIAVVAMAAQNKREKPTLITTEKAFLTNVTEIVTATGKIQPEIEVKIAPEVSGEIIELPVKEGQVVRRGQLLLRIKPDSYRAQVESQQAALSGSRSASVRNRAELAKAESEYRRVEKLYEGGLVSESERNSAKAAYDGAKAALDSAVSNIHQAEGALRQINEALSKTVIYSPVAGTISSLTSRAGERVVGTSQFAGTEVMRIADLDNMEARVNVNENDVVDVKVGDAVRINVDAYPDREIRGVVREIASTALTRNAGTQEEVTNFEVKISIPDRSVRLRPGMSATADIETATVKNVVAVPIQSVTVRSTESNLSPEELERQRVRAEARDREDNRADVTNEAAQKQKERAQRSKLQRIVFVKNGETVKMQKVETGIADNTFIEIRSGLKAGDEVVSGSYTAISRKLKDGAKVEIEKEKT